MTSGDSRGTRREFLKNTGRIAAASALAGVVVPRVHAAEEQHDPGGPDRLRRPGHRRRGECPSATKRPDQAGGHGRRVPGPARRQLRRRPARRSFAEQVDVPEDRQFIGFDAYRKAMDCLKPGDVAILATPPAFRWVHFGYAIEKGLNVFMEKPVDGRRPDHAARCSSWPRSRVKKNLKVGVGLMIRHCRARQELDQRIQDGEIGDIIAAAGLPHARPGRLLRLAPKPARHQRTALPGRSGSTASSGPAAAASATSTSTTSTSAAG